MGLFLRPDAALAGRSKEIDPDFGDALLHAKPRFGDEEDDGRSPQLQLNVWKTRSARASTAKATANAATSKIPRAKKVPVVWEKERKAKMKRLMDEQGKERRSSTPADPRVLSEHDAPIVAPDQALEQVQGQQEHNIIDAIASPTDSSYYTPLPTNQLGQVSPTTQADTTRPTSRASTIRPNTSTSTETSSSLLNPATSADKPAIRGRITVLEAEEAALTLDIELKELHAKRLKVRKELAELAGE